MGNVALKKYPQKTLSDGPSANLRPLHNSNLAKVMIVKWSQIRLPLTEVPFLAYPKLSVILSFNAFSKK